MKKIHITWGNLNINKLRFYLLPQYTQIAAQHDYRIFQKLLQRTRPYVTHVEKATILDIGCGARGSFTLLFHSLGATAIGIDVDILTAHDNFSKYKSILINRGSKQLLTRLISDSYHDKLYYRSLRRLANFPLKFEGLDLRKMNASHTIFEENKFDLVVSNAVFEHIKNVTGVLEETKRIMKPNGIMYAEIHLFPSLTGGHNTLWSNPDTQQVILGGVPPWDHLRKKQYPIEFSLNRLRESEYYALFSKVFRILDWITEYTEPDCYLTPELSFELSNYSREELLHRSIVVIARKT